MNINISDEIIEEIVQQEVAEKMRQYLNNPSYIKQIIEKCVDEALSLQDINKIVDSKCDDLSKNDIANKVAEKLSYRIAKSLYEDSDIDGE